MCPTFLVIFNNRLVSSLLKVVLMTIHLWVLSSALTRECTAGSTCPSWPPPAGESAWRLWWEECSQSGVTTGTSTWTQWRLSSLEWTGEDEGRGLCDVMWVIVVRIWDDLNSSTSFYCSKRTGVLLSLLYLKSSFSSPRSVINIVAPIQILIV